MEIFLEVLGNIAGFALTMVFALIQTWIVAGAIRRVLGVRVGWPRTFLVSWASLMSATPILVWLLSSQMLGEPIERAPVQYLLVAGVVALWVFAISSLVLVVMEVVVPTGSLPTWRSMFLGRKRRKHRNRRYRQVLGVFAKHGLLSQVRGLGKQSERVQQTARSLRQALEEAGVTYVKLGQMLSTREDLLPEPFVQELSRLQNRVDPEPWDAVRAFVETELGRPLPEVFADVRAEPLAAASVAQVHSARMNDGREVVLKVQRPKALGQVEMDVEILGRLAKSLERAAPWARHLGVRGIVRGFTDSLAEELDYGIEVENMRALKSSLDARGVKVPVVLTEHSSSRLIVMERFDGTPVSQAGEILAGLTPEQRAESAQVLLRAVLGQILSDGIFHADLHPGNVVIWPDGSVGLLDFGAVGRLDAITRRHLGTLMWAIDADDPVVATDSLRFLLEQPEQFDKADLQRSIGALITRFRGGFGAAGSLAVFGEVFALVVEHGFRVPGPIAAALRSLGALEGTLKLIDPHLDLVETVRAAGRESVGEITPERVKQQATERAMHLLPLLETLPRRLDQITSDLERGRFTARLRIIEDPDDRRFLTGLVQQLVAAVIAGACVIGGILLATSGVGPMFVPNLRFYEFLGYLLSFAGFVLALRSVAKIFGPVD